MKKALVSSFFSTQHFRQMSTRVLVTGSNGQIGNELVLLMRSRYGAQNVLATDLREPHATSELITTGPFDTLDVTDVGKFEKLVETHKPTLVVHLASLLSAIGEKNPDLALLVNSRGIEGTLQLARKYNFRVFAPSTIAAFGPSTPRDMTPDLTIMRPTTMYGVTKVYLELLGEYFHKKFQVDFRSMRYPGVISNKASPGGGSTDYAIEIYSHAVTKKHYTCYLSGDTAMPMMYMPDCLKATMSLIEAPREKLTQCVYNITAMSFTPNQVAASIQKFIPEFTLDTKIDFRQAIADSWPRSLDDNQARKDWGWSHDYDLDTMTKDMLRAMREKHTHTDAEEASI